MNMEKEEFGLSVTVAAVESKIDHRCWTRCACCRPSLRSPCLAMMRLCSCPRSPLPPWNAMHSSLSRSSLRSPWIADDALVFWLFTFAAGRGTRCTRCLDCCRRSCSRGDALVVNQPLLTHRGDAAVACDAPSCGSRLSPSPRPRSDYRSPLRPRFGGDAL
jgi:hypothetical protein